jgi:alpha-L-arabinofuranosidase
LTTTLRTARRLPLTAALAALLMGPALPPPAGASGRPDTLPPGPPPGAATQVIVTTSQQGTVSPYLFGSNLLWPYDAEGAFDPATDGFYPSFVQEARAMGITAVRYPAGITADSFQWQRAVGGQRQDNEPYGMQDGSLSSVCCTVDAPVPSDVGPDEFGRLLGQLGAVGNVVVNFDTGTAQQAADLVAYMTAPQGEQPSDRPADPGYWAAMRAADGHPAPYDVPYWEVGNEQDGRGQWGWRSGRLVAMGPHTTSCPSADTGMCLYAYGGTTQFSAEPVGTFADTRPQASYSTGAPGQQFYVYFPPVVPASTTVYVNGKAWSPVADLSSAGPDDDVYTLDAATGMVAFGDGAHGAVPPTGARVTATYQSGPHGGFVQFYRAMKAMDPHIKVCESEEASIAFLKTMGRTYPYDCVEVHKYAAPPDVKAPMTDYEEDLMRYPLKQGAAVAALEKEIEEYSGQDRPVVLTEYGQLVMPVPEADPDFNLSLDEALMVGSQLEQWIALRLPLAEKYLLTSAPFAAPGAAGVLAMDTNGLSIDSAMIAGPSPGFVPEPTGQVIGLMSRLAGTQLLASSVRGNPLMSPAPGEEVPALQVVAALSAGTLDLMVLNTSPDAVVPATIDLGAVAHGLTAVARVLDGPSATAYNGYGRAPAVRTSTRSVPVTPGEFTWTFPPHSASLIELPVAEDA